MPSAVGVSADPDHELATGWPSIVACAATAVFAWGFGSYGQAVYLSELQRTRSCSADDQRPK